MNGRLIAIGDIHGCHAEFAEMLERLTLTKDDQLILLGDLVNRGPDSLRVIDLARAANAVSLLGNHELRLLNYRRTKDEDYRKENDQETFDQLRPEDWTYLESMALTYYVEELNTVFVHGGFIPGEAWQKQPAAVVTRVQVIDRDGRRRKRMGRCGPSSGTDRHLSSTDTRHARRSTSSNGRYALTPVA